MSDSVIQFEGTIYEDGYGLLAQRVMRDKKLPRQSKLIYAYMCSFAGIKKDGERTAFPSIKLQCDELGMSEDTYFKWRKYLIDGGYIKITKQRSEEAKFKSNIYSIVAVPKENEKKEEKPCPNSSGMEKKASNQGSNPYPNSSDKEKPSAVNMGTNINNSNINNKDLDTVDTNIDTDTDFSQNELKKKYIERAFYENQNKVPEELAKVFKVFCKSPEESQAYYNSINKAKLDVFSKVLEEKNMMLPIMTIDDEPELLRQIVNTFVRVIRKVERERNIKNPTGYLYKAVYTVIWDYFMPINEVNDWLNEYDN